MEACPIEERLDFIDSWYPLLRKQVMTVLRRGLDNRVLSLTPISYPSAAWDPKTPPHAKAILSIGLILNVNEAVDIITKGPQANESQKSLDFRQFWGEKAELRRFRDGSITESCVWCPATAPIAEKRMICGKICTHLAKRHFNVPDICMHYLGDQFDVAIRVRGSEQNETGEEKALAAIQAFDKVSKDLRNIENIPLPINSVVGTSSIFRYADLNAPKNDGKSFKIGDKQGLMASKSMKAVFQLGKIF